MGKPFLTDDDLKNLSMPIDDQPNQHQNLGKHPITIEGRLSFGQRASDTLTKFCGSWYFIIFTLSIMAVWITVNISMWIFHWDPYPFILLNFVLSTISALQAPIILMSQNRAAERDRIAASYDFMVNMKAEQEIQDMQKDLEEIKKMLRKIKK